MTTVNEGPVSAEALARAKPVSTASTVRDYANGVQIAASAVELTGVGTIPAVAANAAMAVVKAGANIVDGQNPLGDLAMDAVGLIPGAKLATTAGKGSAALVKAAKVL